MYKNICYILKMSFISLPTAKLHRSASYAGRFCSNLANNVDSAVSFDFHGRTADDVNIPSKDAQKYLLATSDFAKGMQEDLNLHVTRDRLNNASFRQKLDQYQKLVFRRQNPIELVFEDISNFDVQNPVTGSLLCELDVGKKDVARL